MQIFMNAMYVVIVLVILIYPGYMLTTESYRLANGGEKAPKNVAIQGAIPIWNNFVIRRQLYYYSGNILKAYFLLIPIIIARVVAMITKMDILLLVTAWLDIFGIIICWLLAAYVAMDVGKMVAVSGFKMLLCFLVPPLGCYVIARSIGPYIKHSGDELEDRFLSDE